MRSIHIFFLFFAMLCIGPATGSSAQVPPPVLPDAPSQAPIDGGLGLLAVGGGVYAWKRLKRR